MPQARGPNQNCGFGRANKSGSTVIIWRPGRPERAATPAGQASAGWLICATVGRATADQIRAWGNAGYR